jgi:hypothetical protein
MNPRITWRFARGHWCWLGVCAAFVGCVTRVPLGEGLDEDGAAGAGGASGSNGAGTGAGGQGNASGGAGAGGTSAGRGGSNAGSGGSNAGSGGVGGNLGGLGGAAGTGVDAASGGSGGPVIDCFPDASDNECILCAKTNCCVELVFCAQNSVCGGDGETTCIQDCVIAAVPDAGLTDSVVASCAAQCAVGFTIDPTTNDFIGCLYTGALSDGGVGNDCAVECFGG